MGNRDALGGGGPCNCEGQRQRSGAK
jgi:hypothetical protein